MKVLAYSNWFRIFTVVSLAIGVTACSDSSEVDFSKCELLDYEQTLGLARVSDQSILLKSIDSRGEKHQQVLMESWIEQGGPSTTGIQRFDSDVNYQTCSYCLTLETGCQNTTCEKLYLATTGNVQLQAVSTQEGSPVGLRVNELMFEEITLDGDFRSTKVEGAKAYCLRDVGLSGLVGVADEPTTKEVEASQPQDACVSAGTGTGIGHNIKNFNLQNCLGETVSLHDVCGTYQAIWMVTTAGWCTACESWVPQVQERYEELADQGLGLYVFLGADLNFGVPTLEYCASYAEQKGLDPSRVLVDDGWEILFENVDHYDYNFTPLNFMLDGKNMAYVWSDAANDGTTTTLNQALGSLLE